MFSITFHPEVSTFLAVCCNQLTNEFPEHLLTCSLMHVSILWRQKCHHVPFGTVGRSLHKQSTTLEATGISDDMKRYCSESDRLSRYKADCERRLVKEDSKGHKGQKNQPMTLSASAVLKSVNFRFTSPKESWLPSFTSCVTISKIIRVWKPLLSNL